MTEVKGWHICATADGESFLAETGLFPLLDRLVFVAIMHHPLPFDSSTKEVNILARTFRRAYR